MGVSKQNIHSIDDFNEWLDKARVFAANNWDRLDDCEVIIGHDPVFTGQDHGWDTWKEGSRFLSITVKVKAPK